MQLLDLDSQCPLRTAGPLLAILTTMGKIDIVVAVLNGPPQLLKNCSQNHNHWIILKLVGVRSNRDGLGTKIKR